MADRERTRDDEFADVNDEEISGRGDEDDEDFEDAEDSDEDEEEDEERGI